MLKGHNFSHCAGPGLCLPSTVQHPQGEEGGSLDLKTEMGTVAKPETQLPTISVGPIVKKKPWKKSTCSVREKEASPKREQDEESVVQQSTHKNRRGKRQKS